MESDDDVPLILTWDEANSGLLNEEAERGDESKFKPSFLHSIIVCLFFFIVAVNFMSSKVTE